MCHGIVGAVLCVGLDAETEGGFKRGESIVCLGSFQKQCESFLFEPAVQHSCVDGVENAM